MAPQNKIVKLDKFSMSSDLGHVQVVDAPMPDPKQGEVLVNAYLRPVNPTDDILIKTGWGGLVPLPSTPGSEGVGKVVKNGPGASKFKEGQRVAAAPWPQFQGRGSWAQYVAVPEKDLVGHCAQVDLVICKISSHCSYRLGSYIVERVMNVFFLCRFWYLRV